MAVITRRTSFWVPLLTPFFPLHNSKTLLKSFFKLANSLLHITFIFFIPTALSVKLSIRNIDEQEPASHRHTQLPFYFFSLFLHHHSHVQSWLSNLKGFNFKNNSIYPRPHISNIRNRELLWILSHRALRPTMYIQRSTDGDRQSWKLVSISRKSK